MNRTMRLRVVMFLLLTLKPSGAVRMEPRCTEFHYMEQLLEKLVRMENKMDAMQDKLQKDISLLRDEIKAVDEKADDLQVAIDTLQDDVQRNVSLARDDIKVVNEATGDLRTTVDAFQAKQLDRRMDDIEKEVDKTASKLQEEEPVIAFAVYLKETKTYSTGDPVVFDNVLANIGSHYSVDTGKFTAPKSGVYVFSWNTQSTEDLLTCLSHNGDCKIHAYAHGKASQSSNIIGDGNNAVLELRKGDAVWIEVGSGNKLYSNNGMKWFYPTFTGHILH